MASRFHAIWLLSALALPQAGAPQQAPAPLPTGAISGVVVDGTDGAPVANALVYLSARAGVSVGSQPRQLTDGKGRFAFVNLAPDTSYTVSASKFGYLDGGYGRDNGPGDPLRQIAVKDHDWIGNLRVPLWKPGSISGTVRDENGEPVVGVFVRALVRYRMQGRDELASGPMTVTDDRGAYRLAGLAPGKYVIQVPSVQAAMSAGTPAPRAEAQDGVLEMDDTSRLVIGRYPLPPPSNGRQMAYPIAFHQTGSLVAQATAIELKFGDDRPNVDVSLAPVPAVRVSGVVEGPPDAMSLLTLRLLPAGLENLGHGSEAATAFVAPDGRFTFLNVPAGTYTIDAPVKINEFVSTTGTGRRVNFPVPPGVSGWGNSSDAPDSVTGLQFSTSSFRGGNVPAFSGRATVIVGGSDVAGVVVRLRPQGTMVGRIVIENDPSKPAPATPPRFTLSLDPAGGEAYLGRPNSTSQPTAPTEFVIAGVMPGQYWIRQTGNAAWVVKSVSWKGRDYSSQPIDATADDLTGVQVTLTNAVPELTGSVRAVDDLKPDESLVIVFPADSLQWRNMGLWPARAKSAMVSAAGVYRVASLPAGSYLVAAIDRRYRTGWNDPDFLAQVARTASPVTLTWGGKTSLDVTVTKIR